ncbi:restriction endonuclease subunit S [Vibrio paracholerae]|uniref:restriction endonuclease subunit S n=1 Tax=Vibrio paracholerae TaxID=650003 RepID=UPI00208C10CA|nr:restriction endonuclease subunit S [Vibrio paracholerae]MCO7023022.1 restriction endonuclease subunit S [Vibrio paracholerae]GIA57898.1 Type I restriction-modification system, specificity subunit S [Vibrio cholerae]
MTGRYKAYSEYKGSGIEWLKDMPSHWELIRAKHLFQRVQRPVRPQDGIVTAFRDGEVTLRSNRRTDGFTNAAKEIGYQGVRKGDLLVHAMDGFAGAIGISDSDGKCSPVCSVCIPRKSHTVDPTYFGYLVRQLAVTDYITSLAKGIRERSTEFRFAEFASLFLAAPPKEEQQKIAHFLDHETAKIDTLITKQEKLIELLKEKRQAVISHAVTKGLNPDAPMKDSGVEWLGEVPEHWAVVKCGYLGRLFGSEAISDDLISDNGDVPFVKVSTLSLDSFDLAEKSFFVDCSKVPMSKAKSNYVVFPKRGAAIFTNKVNIVKDKSFIDPNLMGWELDGNVLPEYVAFMLKLRGLSDIADVSTVPQINNKHIEPMKFPLPPITEQKEILESLSGQVTNLNLLVQKASEAIELMKERKTALISAAVTGKIDVRDWAGDC